VSSRVAELALIVHRFCTSNAWFLQKRKTIYLAYIYISLAYAYPRARPHKTYVLRECSLSAEEGAREPPTATYLSPVHQDKGYGSIEGRNACIKVYIHSVESLLIL
jgi:hypothetical protein